MHRMNPEHHEHQHDALHEHLHGSPFGAGGGPGKGPKGPRRGGPHRGGPHRGGPHRGGPWSGRGGPEFAEGLFGAMGTGAFRFGGPRRGPGRGQRGDVRNAIIALLVEQPMNGYQMITAIADRTQGLWRPSAGSVYPALGLLQDEGLVHQVEVEGKKAFELTAEGRNYAEAHAEELDDPWARVAQPHEGFLDVRREVGQLAMALQQVVMAGDPAQVKAARAVLDGARKDLYRILAGDSASDD